MIDGFCDVEIEKKIWDLGATMKAEIFEKTDPHGPVTVIHENQDFVLRVEVKLTGKILHYLCGTLCVAAGFESCGWGPEKDIYKDVKLDPCGDGIYKVDLEVPAGTLQAGHCAKTYDICVTLGSFDYCGHPGFAFGHCQEFSVTIAPAVVH